MTAILHAPLVVRKTVQVRAPQATAFDVFTARIAAWWPMPTHHIGSAEVRFTAIDAHHTRVELEHRGLEAFGPAAETMRDQLGSPNGWNGMLDHYAEVAGR